MKSKKLLKIIGFLAVSMSVTGIACGSHQTGPDESKFLLHGFRAASSDNFDFYSINDDTAYAVALKDSKKNVTSTIEIIDEYNGKPVTGIWRYGFANSRASSFIIPDSITVIDYEAFMNSKISTLTIPATVSAIGEGAFYTCKSLNKVSIHNSTTSESSSACSCEEVSEGDTGERIYSTLSLIPSFCFFNCSNLKELVLPQSIEEIGYEAFNGCSSLYSTLAFMNIKAIRSRAFQGCSALKNIYISSSFFEKDSETHLPIGVIEDKAFEKCNGSLKFWLVGTTSDVQDWLDLHTDNKWRWKDETTNPATTSNLYAYEITESGASYSNDWIYTTVNNEVEITSYIGPTEIEGVAVKFISFPNELPSGSGNKVTKIAIGALDPVKSQLQRVYLPQGLKRIEANMFNGDYDNLIVIDDNKKCKGDDETEGEIAPRIVLNDLKELEVIGNRAFVKMDKLRYITKLYLPYSLKAVGTSAFGTSDNDYEHMMACTDFRWDYDDEKSALKVIGKEAFYELGRTDKAKTFTYGSSAGNIHQGRYYIEGGVSKERYKLTTLIIPRTFEHFGITGSDNSLYNLGSSDNNDGNFGRRAFAGCHLLSKVVFKGSKKSKVEASAASDSDTFDLVIPTQTFGANESLRTIVFEERCGKNILFHSLGGVGVTQPAIGWTSGISKNDFGGDPALQTIVLPNRYTTIRMQNFAMQGNSRAAVYLSGASNSKMYGSTTTSCLTSITNITSDQVDISTVPQWGLIGDEGFYNGGYPGYCFAGANNNISTDKQNRYGLNQSMPVYGNVLYQETITAPGINNVEVFVGLGTSNSENEYVEQNKCAFVCGASTATMTKYLYDRYDSSFTGTAKVPATVTRSNSTVCTVNVIGASAFSAAYCDSTSYKNDTIHKDLSEVLIPDTIATIGEYAFMRAYGVTKLTAYDPSNDTAHDDYVMPSSLTSIGKQAFAFCNIKEFLNIPNGCKFYENDNDTTNETSVFSNNFSLRKITFGNNAVSSTYYTTTTYTHSGSSDTYTSAIYSTSSVPSNKNSLLLVLYRDSVDYLSASADCTISETTNEFNGRHSSKYIYGAFKMCYWVDSLVVGTSHNAELNQPLISGIYNVAGKKDRIVYLNTAYDFTGDTCNLKSISFGEATTLSTPPYSFSGCEKLEKVRLPRVVGGHVPAGLFAFIENEHIVFEVPGNEDATTWKTCEEGELDLTYTAYKYIDAEAFKNTNITTVIAPITDTFTIEQDAFANCSNLASIDFSHVTERVTLNASFRESTINNDLFTFGDSAKIVFGKQTFMNCTFPGKTFTFPAKTAIIGDSCFEYCSTLENVTAEEVLTQLESVVVENGRGKNNAGNNTGFKQIGNFAFHNCTNLKNFDFDKFAQIERIGHYAFSMAPKTSKDNEVIQPETGNTNHNAIICTGGIVNLPASITNLGVGVFNSSKITKAIINSSSIKFERGKDYTTDDRVMYNKGGHQFRRCSTLTTVLFTNPDCSWQTLYLLKNKDGQDNFFSGCGQLTQLTMPKGYDIQYPSYTGSSNDKRPDSMVWDSNVNLKVYVYHTVNDLRSDKPAINEYWHRMSNNSTAPIVFFVSNNADVVTGGAGSYHEISAGKVYWTLDNGEIIYLGSVVSVDATTGLVTFSVAGCTADSSGVHHS